MKWKQLNTSRNNLNFYSSQFFEKYEKDIFQYGGQLVENDIHFNSNY